MTASHNGSHSNIAVLPLSGKQPHQTVFHREELNAILNIYGRMVAAGQWRDYAIEFGRDTAIFAAFRHASQRPEIRIEKCPAQQRRQGQWLLRGEAGQVLKRGHDLSNVLAPVERRLIKVVEE
ncbi:DUF2794 domain-containing protein [Alterisphingorhabdus coralli]|uniref:DUF2794 domain-containing protein n=1 Tax=Alterisphingorhabdus coralli TaxID=3071408 RepID=A0AA97F4N5_9SPHN|nr:DUF2794 domain-containing protein [Parasphingorhabdus sp. SCSIO 66989]WOE74244.1 DUF2794 domain-containing protein [Parasphingorhabdus sp. SCSIO 66989]